MAQEISDRKTCSIADGNALATQPAPTSHEAPIKKYLRQLSFADANALLDPSLPHSDQSQQTGFAKIREHRGRLQIQGGGVEASWPWTRAAPPTAQESLSGLQSIWRTLSPREQKTRDEAYAKARAYIIGVAPNGVDAPVSRTFQNANLRPNERDHRVDIEVIKGKAFVGPGATNEDDAALEAESDADRGLCSIPRDAAHAALPTRSGEAHWRGAGGRSGGGGASSSW